METNLPNPICQVCVNLLEGTICRYPRQWWMVWKRHSPVARRANSFDFAPSPWYHSKQCLVSHPSVQMSPIKTIALFRIWSVRHDNYINCYCGDQWPNEYHDFRCVCVYIYIWLVVLTILKNISQWDGLSHISWKNIKCLKPPTIIYIYILMIWMPGISWWLSLMAPAVIPIAQLVALRDDKGLARIHDLNSWQSTFVSLVPKSSCLFVYVYT